MKFHKSLYKIRKFDQTEKDLSSLVRGRGFLSWDNIFDRIECFCMVPSSFHKWEDGKRLQYARRLG